MGMTIAIKDFEMPQSCYNCNFCLRRRTSDYGYFGMCDLTNEDGINLYEHSRSEDCPLVEAIPKDQYEARLKADMVAELKEIREEIDHSGKDLMNGTSAEYAYTRGWNDALDYVLLTILEKKISELEG